MGFYDEVRTEAREDSPFRFQVRVIKDFSGHGSPSAKFKGEGDIPYVRVADIVNWDIYKNPTSGVPEHVYKAIKANGVNLEERDVLFVRRGSYRIGSVAMVSKQDTKVLLTREIHVFRVTDEHNKYDIDAFYLLYLFSHKLTQEQLENKIMIDTTLPNIGRRWEELYLPVAKDPKERQKIREKIKQALTKKWEGQEKLAQLQKEFGNLTT